MIESNLEAGNQSLKPGVTSPSSLKYGVSVTDACIDWATTVKTLQDLAASVRAKRVAQK
jgi:3-deoxy-7-phosphoheptulonate synthase